LASELIVGSLPDRADHPVPDRPLDAGLHRQVVVHSNGAPDGKEKNGFCRYAKSVQPIMYVV
jgi:hypothetical protein